MRAKIAKMCESNKKQRVDRKRAENEIIVEDMTEEEYSSLMNESVLLQTEVEDEVDDSDSCFLKTLDVPKRNVNDLCWHKDAGKQFKSAYSVVRAVYWQTSPISLLRSAGWKKWRQMLVMSSYSFPNSTASSISLRECGQLPKGVLGKSVTTLTRS